MWIDEMMMCSPLAPSTSTTCQESIIEQYSTDNFVRCKWTLESYIPASTTIHISTEIDQVSRFYSICVILTEIHFDHFSYLIDQISLAYSSELQEDIPMEDNSISSDLDISIVSEGFDIGNW